MFKNLVAFVNLTSFFSKLVVLQSLNIVSFDWLCKCTLILILWITDFTGGTKNGAPSIHESLRDREQGAHSGSAAYRPKEVGMRGKRWTSVLNGRLVLSDFSLYWWFHYLRGHGLCIWKWILILSTWQVSFLGKYLLRIVIQDIAVILPYNHQLNLLSSSVLESIMCVIYALTSIQCLQRYSCVIHIFFTWDMWFISQELRVCFTTVSLPGIMHLQVGTHLESRG